jgi:hypothetical protein
LLLLIAYFSHLYFYLRLEMALKRTREPAVAVSSAQSKRGLQRVAVAYDGMRATVCARQIVCLGLFTPQRDLALR